MGWKWGRGWHSCPWILDSCPWVKICPPRQIYQVLNYTQKPLKVGPLVAQMVNSLPAMLESQVWSLGREDPLEKGMATHSSILAWRIPWTEEPGGLQSMRLQRVGYKWSTKINIEERGKRNRPSFLRAPSFCHDFSNSSSRLIFTKISHQTHLSLSFVGYTQEYR